MEFKRTTEIFVETNRRFVIRQSEAEQFFCPNCAEPMLAAEQAAAVFGISQRRVFQLIESSVAHFTETETGAVLVCLASLREILETGAKHLPGETTDNF